MIFSRGRGRHSRDDDPRRGARNPGGRDATERAAARRAEEAADGADEAPGSGPYDVSEAPAGVTRIDLGSLQIPAVDGVEVRVQASQDGAVQQVVLVHGDSALQLGVFAAPRSAGIWDEVRAEIRESLAAAQSVEELDGAYGPELRARVRTPDGPVDLRFVGVDGPRWMVQALFQGRVATDPDAAPPLVECLAGLVVDRGREAMPVREALPLRLPRDVAEQATRQGEEAAAAEAGAPEAAAGPGVNGRPAAGGTPGSAGPSRGPRPKPSPRPPRPA